MKNWPLFLLLTLLWGCTAPADEAPSRPPNVVWIIAEDISPALGCYGDPLARTPNIDRLASAGIRYDKAYATAPICAPSRSCLMTGLYATTLGTQHLRCEIPFPQQLKTLPEHLQAAGYFTSNRNKTDYNFDPQGRWQHWSGSYAPWRHRTNPDQPFYSFINVGPSHEGSANREERYRESVQNLPETARTDPDQVTVPPYYPDTEECRTVWAHYYDLLQVMDQNVGKILDSLEADGLLEETIVFFFGDHGFGMPRYKRWLYQTGLNVPLVIRVPASYQNLAPYPAGSHTDQLVSFVDFVPTVLNLAGAAIPTTMQGQPFLGPDLPAQRKFVFGARDRADDMYEMSRAVADDRYIYIRHFMPYLPYIQEGFIYSDGKHAFRALNEARAAGLTNEEQEKLWRPKPVEELYDLREDPRELVNLANAPGHQDRKAKLKERLHSWMINHRDLGLLPEASYMIRSTGTTPYNHARDSSQFDAARLLAAAEMVGNADPVRLRELSSDPDDGVRYWVAVALTDAKTQDTGSIQLLRKLLQDEMPSVQIQAAEALGRIGGHPEAVSILGTLVQDDRPWVALQAARTIQLIGDEARPLIPTLYQVLDKNLGEPGKRLKYKDFNFAAFTSWALEWALQEMGEEIEIN